MNDEIDAAYRSKYHRYAESNRRHHRQSGSASHDAQARADLARRCPESRASTEGRSFRQSALRDGRKMFACRSAAGTRAGTGS
jgi:hypothetical protein